MGVEAKVGPLNEYVEWFLDHLKVQRGASEHTVAAYAKDLEFASRRLVREGVTRWEGLTPEAVARLQRSLGPPTSPATAQRRMSALRSFLKFLKRQGCGPPMDLPSTGGFKKPRALPKALPVESMAALLEAPDISTPLGLRDRALLELIYGAGLRVSEACGLRLQELDLDGRSVRVTGKRGKTRWVPLPPETASWLERYLRDGRPRLLRTPLAELFVSARGLRLRRTTLAAKLKALTRQAGLPDDTSPHTLRHTYAVHLLKGGADLRVVQELLGHASIATTQVYTQLDVDEVRRRYLAAHPRR